MNIAIIESKLDGKGGSQRQALSFALALQKLGHSVIVYTLSCAEDKCFPEILAELKVVSLKEKPPRPKEIILKPFGFLNYFIRSNYENCLAQNLALLISPDTHILNPHDRLGFRVAAFYKKKVRNIPSIAMMSDIITKTWSNWRKSQFDLYLQPSLAERIWYAILDTYEVRKFILPHEGMTVLDSRTQKWAKQYFGKEAIIIRSGLDLDKFCFWERQPLEGRRVKVFLVGAFFFHRRYEDAIRAVKIARDQGLDIELSIAGDYSSNSEYNNYYTRLSSLARELEIGYYVNFLGKISDEELLRCYRDYDIYISSNHLQSWGLAVFEAMASGLPVIVSSTAGASEVLGHRENAMIVEAKSPEKIAAILEEYIKNPSLYLALSKAGRKFVEENISWERSAKNLLNVFESTLMNHI